MKFNYIAGVSAWKHKKCINSTTTNAMPNVKQKFQSGKTMFNFAYFISYVLRIQERVLSF